MKLSTIAAALACALSIVECSEKMVIGYLPNWLYANYPVENVPYEKYTHLNYAFAILNNPDNLPSFPDDWAVESGLPKIVKLAHEKNTKVLLSVGGWTGSKRFSPMVAQPESRKKFIDWNLDFIEKYGTDGVDIDWEYPGKQAAGCNEVAPNDADNFLLLLKEMREALDKKFTETHKEISMAVHVKPFVKDNEPMKNVEAFVPYFDHINLMTYDINGAWATETGPNAPFMVESGKGAPYSFVESIRDWKEAGVPASKITAGLAFYGRTMKAEVDMTAEPHQYQKSEVGAPKGDSDDAYWADPYCNLDIAGLSGVWKWTNIRSEGLLKEDKITPGDGWKRYWDDVTKTPWLFNPSTKHYISYDDPQSLDIKVQHALCEDLAGVMVWDIHQDNGELVDVANKIHGAAPTTCDVLLKSSVNGTAPIEAVHDAKPPPVAAELPESEDEDYDEDYEDHTEGQTVPAIVTPPVEPTPPVAPTTSDAPPAASSPASEPASPATPSPDATSLASEPTGPPSLAGGECSIEGQQKCIESGVSSQWLTCDDKKWIVRDCAPSLVCKEFNGGGIYCDFAPK